MKTFKKHILLLILLFLALTFFNGCASISLGTTEDKQIEKTIELTQIQKKLLTSAEYYKGTSGTKIIADDKTYNLDCSGSMLAIYYKSGIYLEKCYQGYSGNGVNRIYSCLKDYNLLHYSQYPAPGDLIFWDNTYDSNGDNKFNDYLTHIGMVISVDKNGTITYIHDNYRKGLIYEKMNLIYPKNRELNSVMRMKNSPKGPNNESLAGELVKVFGQAWLLPKSFLVSLKAHINP